MKFSRISVAPRQMGGVPCVRSPRIPVATVIGTVADGSFSLSKDFDIRDQDLLAG